MPRYAREKGKSGIYHIMLRGINKQDIFEEDEDRYRFIETVNKYKEVSKYEVYGYCLMSNHVHLLLGEKEEPLAGAVKRICGSYVYWYNLKYARCGHFFQERFKSEPVDDDSYLLTVLRYIHQNPVKAGLVKNCSEYRWSSYHEYMERAAGIVTDKAIVLELLSNDRRRAIVLFIEYMNEANEDQCLEFHTKKKITDNDIREYFNNLGLKNISELQSLEKNRRDELLRTIKAVDGITIRQLSRVTGISKSVIDRA